MAEHSKHPEPEKEQPRPQPTRDHVEKIEKRGDYSESIPARVQPVDQWSEPDKKNK